MWREMRSEDLLRFSAGRVSGWTSLGLGLLRAAAAGGPPRLSAGGRGLLARVPVGSLGGRAPRLGRIEKTGGAGISRALWGPAPDVWGGRAVFSPETRGGVPATGRPIPASW